MTVKFKRYHKNALIPVIGSEGAACKDVVATEIYKHSASEVTVKLGFGLGLPVGYKAVITPRSSFTHKGWVLANSPCIGDKDFTGEYMLKFEAIPYGVDTNELTGWQCLEYQPFPYEVGDRVAQLSIERVIYYQFEEVEELDETERGHGSFGSTGR